MSEIELHKVLDKIDIGKENWRDIIPAKQFDWFVERVNEAIKIFYELWDPPNLAAELRQIEKASRHPPAELLSLVGQATPMARNILEQHDKLPATPATDDQKVIAEFARDVRSRVVASGYWKPEGPKRRRITKVVGSLPFRRPKLQRMDMLISFIAAAYVGATGKALTRSWSDDEYESPIEMILGDIIGNLQTNDTNSVKKAIRRHMEKRETLVGK